MHDKSFLNARDIAYISQNSAFNIRKSFFLKQLAGAILLICFSLIGVVPFLQNYIAKKSLEMIDILSLFPFFLALVYMTRFLKSLKFTKLKNNSDIQQNFELVRLFLMQKNIRFVENNDTIQIAGRKYDNNFGTQEIVYFIPKNNCVLVNHIIANSSLINVGWLLPYASQFKVLTKELSSWIREKQALN